MGAWIEIEVVTHTQTVILSLPLWERGLKSVTCNCGIKDLIVAPLVGAWIEINRAVNNAQNVRASLPLWERGLKFSPKSLSSDIECRSPCGSVD